MLQLCLCSWYVLRCAHQSDSWAGVWATLVCVQWYSGGVSHSWTCSTIISSTEYKSLGFPPYVRWCIDMLAVMSHRRAVCRGNLVFCSTHRNLSVHRPNTNHSDSLHTSDGALICLHS